MTSDPPSAVGQAAAWLAGDRDELTGPRAGARRLERIAAILETFPNDPSARHVAAEFRGWLSEGGDLLARLDLRPRRGGAHELPARAIKRDRRDQAVRELARGLIKPNKPAAIAQMVKARDPLILHIEERTCPVPASPAQLKRILRADAPSGDLETDIL